MSLTQPTISRRRARGEEIAPGRSAEPQAAGREKIRPFLRRWLTAGMLLAASLLAVLYISNAIAVNELTTTIASLEQERDVVRGENEKLRAELLRLMSVERVSTIAAGRLGMVQPLRPPQALAPAARMEAAVAGSDSAALQ